MLCYAHIFVAEVDHGTFLRQNKISHQVRKIVLANGNSLCWVSVESATVCTQAFGPTLSPLALVLRVYEWQRGVLILICINGKEEVRG